MFKLWAIIVETYVVNSSHMLQVKTNKYCNTCNFIQVWQKSRVHWKGGKPYYLCRVWQRLAWSHQISSGKTDWMHRDSGCDVSAASYHHLNHPSSSGRKRKKKKKNKKIHHATAKCLQFIYQNVSFQECENLVNGLFYSWKCPWRARLLERLTIMYKAACILPFQLTAPNQDKWF